jgi:hypothetical protein
MKGFKNMFFYHYIRQKDILEIFQVKYSSTIYM